MVISSKEEGKDHEKKKTGSDFKKASTKPEFEAGEDPINHLGYGIVSYFNLIKTLILIMFVLTLLNIPTMQTYYKHHGLG
jgi:hypothetical protein